MEDMRQFRNVDVEERRRDLIDIINKRARRAGVELPSDVKTFVLDVEEMILEHFPYITMNEIAKAQENGFSGKYSNKAMRSGIYADKIISFIRSYREEMGYYSKVNSQQTTDVELPSVTSAEGIRNFVISWFNEHNSWLNERTARVGGNIWVPYGKWTTEPARLVYDALYHMGVIELYEPIDDYKTKAVEKIRMDRIEKDESPNDITEIEVTCMAKKLYMMDYFLALNIEGKTINDVIRGKEVPQKYVNMRNYELSH